MSGVTPRAAFGSDDELSFSPAFSRQTDGVVQALGNVQQPNNSTGVVHDRQMPIMVLNHETHGIHGRIGQGHACRLRCHDPGEWGILGKEILSYHIPRTVCIGDDPRQLSSFVHYKRCRVAPRLLLSSRATNKTESCVVEMMGFFGRS